MQKIVTEERDIEQIIDNDYLDVTIEQMGEVFMIVPIGIILAAIIFFIEIVIYRLKQTFRKNSNNLFTKRSHVTNRRLKF